MNIPGKQGNMEVILDNEKKPRGVFLSLTEWETVKTGVNKASNLYKLMDELSHPDIFDMNPEQFSAYTTLLAEDLVNKALDEGLYFSYPANSPESPDLFIHQYQHERKLLIAVDSLTGKEHFIRNL